MLVVCEQEEPDLGPRTEADLDVGNGKRSNHAVEHKLIRRVDQDLLDFSP